MRDEFIVGQARVRHARVTSSATFLSSFAWSMGTFCQRERERGRERENTFCPEERERERLRDGEREYLLPERETETARETEREREDTFCQRERERLR